jgi:hypothetical protein
VTSLVLRANAVVVVLAGLALVLTTWDRLYDALDLPNPGAAPYAQTGGVFTIAFGYLLWIAPREERSSARSRQPRRRRTSCSS